MKFTYTLILLTIFGIKIYAQDERVFVNDPNAQQRPVQSFSQISISGAFDLYLSQFDGDETLVVSAASPELRDYIKTEVSGDVLQISYSNAKYKGNKNLKVYASFKTLRAIAAAGSTDVFVNGVLKTDDLKVTLAGASDFKAALDVEKLMLSQSGSSDSKISGRAGRVSISVSGASDVSGFDLETEYCDAVASGASDISITVNKELNATASGASDISYKGNGVAINVKKSGSSSIVNKN